MSVSNTVRSSTESPRHPARTLRGICMEYWTLVRTRTVLAIRRRRPSASEGIFSGSEAVGSERHSRRTSG
ncbi:hypothetical protein NY08_1373 [Rhodococcus sp. B7740]|nr:hypothetical protein NY08_1373 [Rhodococcus sp. B7740]